MWSIINQLRGAIQPPCMLCGAHPHHHDNLCGPCLIDIPWTKLAPEKGASFFEIASILQKQFGVVHKEGLWSFFKAKP